MIGPLDCVEFEFVCGCECTRTFYRLAVFFALRGPQPSPPPALSAPLPLVLSLGRTTQRFHNAMSSAARQRHKRARVPLVLRIHKPPATQQTTNLPRHTLISTFHTLIKRKQQLQSTPTTPTTSTELTDVDKQLEALGGLEWYQRISVAGEKRGGGGGVGFTTAKWVMERLSGKEEWKEVLLEVRASKRRKRQKRDSTAATTEQQRDSSQQAAGQRDERKEETDLDCEEEQQERKEAVSSATPSHPFVTSPSISPPLLPSSHSRRRRPRLLDVGSLNNPYQPYTHLLDLLAIDLNPQHPSVQPIDFFHLPHTSRYRGWFDGIVLSLVMNFVGSEVLRGRMLRRCSGMLVDGGWLWCVLPAACVANSRWVDESVVRALWRRCGLRVSEVHWSSKLVLIEATTDRSGVDGSAWKPSMVRHGAQHNNFSIALEAAEDDTGETPAAQSEDEP